MINEITIADRKIDSEITCALCHCGNHCKLQWQHGNCISIVEEAKKAGADAIKKCRPTGPTRLHLIAIC